MKDWTRALLSEHASLRETMAVIDEGSAQIALVVDSEQRLLGVVTDGDIRRGLLRGIGLEAPVALVMRRTPLTVGPHDGREKVLKLMKTYDLKQVPVIDEQCRVVGLHVLKLASPPTERDNWVVLMVGGLGQRLRPFTEVLPKPLLPVGGKPLLVTIIESLVAQGFRKLYLSVNYMADMVETVIGDGARFGAKVEYLREQSKLGTAGALGLLPKRPTSPLVIMNGDLLTKVDFGQLLAFHGEQRGAATMAVREYGFQIPYGVIDIVENQVRRIHEKPVQSYFVNAGIYVLQPEVLDLVRPGAALDMPDLLDDLIANERQVAAFPIREYWMDIGTSEDFARASAEYNAAFQ